MNKTVAVIEGDDAAPEAMRPVVALLDSLQLGLSWVRPQVGETAQAATGSTFPDAARELIDAADTTLFGSTSGKSGAALGYLRWGKETYANVRPCRYLPGCASPLARPDGIDFVIVRENLEDLYVGAEGPLEDLAPLGLVGRTVRRPVHELGTGCYAIKAITREGTERVVRFAFQLAAARTGRDGAGEPKVTCATKHNMLRDTDGLFLQVASEVAEDHPDIAFESYIVDDFACRMIREPERFDVVVMPNQYERHSVRCRRRAARQSRTCGERLLRQGLRVLRAGPRHRAGHRGAEHHQSHGHDPLRDDDARLSRARPSGTPHRSGSGPGVCRRCGR